MNDSRGRTLIFVTQTLDPADSVLGFVPTYLSPLSRRVERLVVIANEVRSVPEGLNAEVISLGKELGHSRARRFLRYETVLSQLARRRGPTSLIAHMCPIYLTLAAPIMRAADAPTLLWFAHPADSPTLRMAERLAAAVITTAPGSYPRESRKVHYIGQGIDMATFQFAPPDTGRGLNLVALGRTSPDKRFPLIIEALRRVRTRGVAASLRIVGPATTGAEIRHRADLDRVIADPALGGSVSLHDGVEHACVPRLLSESSALVNATADGSADKTVFETAACGRPVLAASRAFDSLLEGLPLDLRFAPDDLDGLTEGIVGLARASSAELASISRELRSRVEREHSNDHWADQVVSVSQTVSRG
jgi:glycosyltransferase involved in cell wall biosynthesis